MRGKLSPIKEKTNDQEETDEDETDRNASREMRMSASFIRIGITDRCANDPRDRDLMIIPDEVLNHSSTMTTNMTYSSRLLSLRSPIQDSDSQPIPIKVAPKMKWKKNPNDVVLFATSTRFALHASRVWETELKETGRKLWDGSI